MRTKLIAILIAAFLLGGAIYYNETRVPEAIPAAEIAQPASAFAPFPDIAFRTPDNHAIRITDLKEKTILVHFWAAWCAPCRAEFPALLQYVVNAHGAIGLLSVSLDGDYANSEKMLHDAEGKSGISTSAPHLYWAWDKGNTISLRHFNTVKVPETIVVNDKRQMADKIIGEGPWMKNSTVK